LRAGDAARSASTLSCGGAAVDLLSQPYSYSSITPLILGVVLGGMLEENFISSMIKADGNLLAFFSRPIAAGLGALTIAIWFWPLLRRRRRSRPVAA
jgi:TctA family transporter